MKKAGKLSEPPGFSVVPTLCGDVVSGCCPTAIEVGRKPEAEKRFLRIFVVVVVHENFRGSEQGVQPVDDVRGGTSELFADFPSCVAGSAIAGVRPSDEPLVQPHTAVHLVTSFTAVLDLFPRKLEVVGCSFTLHGACLDQASFDDASLDALRILASADECIQCGCCVTIKQMVFTLDVIE